MYALALLCLFLGIIGWIALTIVVRIILYIRERKENERHRRYMLGTSFLAGQYKRRY